MEKKYIYIEDDPHKVIADGFIIEGKLSVNQIQPDQDLSKQITKLISEESNIDGVIVDLRLDEIPNEQSGQSSEYRGTSLAQEIRTRQKEAKIKEFPIVLFSANENINNSLEDTGNDLFDLVLSKELDVDEYNIVRIKLQDLAISYRKLAEEKDVSKILCIDDSDFSRIDDRFLKELKNKIDNNAPVHVVARFLINELLEKTGLLISEDVLAARLGISKTDSKDWDNLLCAIKDAKYSGCFSCGWTRWWMYKIDEWWESITEDNVFLRRTSAKERVDIIKRRMSLPGLTAAKKTNGATSDEFWTVCKGCGMPLDPIDGLLVLGQDNIYPWQDMDYILVDTALKRFNIDKWKGIAAIDEDRFNIIKAQKNRTL